MEKGVEQHRRWNDLCPMEGVVSRKGLRIVIELCGEDGGLLPRNRGTLAKKSVGRNVVNLGGGIAGTCADVLPENLMPPLGFWDAIDPVHIREMCVPVDWHTFRPHRHQTLQQGLA